MLLNGPWQANGVCRVAESWARILTSGDHEVTIVCEEGDGAPDIPGARMVTHPVASTSNRFRRWKERQAQLVRTVMALDAQRPFDVHLSHDWLPTTAVRRALPNARLAQSIHSPMVDENQLNNWRYAPSLRHRALYPATLAMAWRLEAQALRAVDRVHTLSEYTWRRMGLRHARLCDATPRDRIPGSFDHRRFVLAPDREQVRRDLGLPVNAKILWTVRRLVPRNGVDRIAECAQRVRDRDEEILFVIGGTIVWSAALAFIDMMNQGTATIEDILLLFIYMELGAMVDIYFYTNHMPVRFLIYVGMTALTRQLIGFISVEHKPDIGVLIISGAIVLLALGVLVLRYGSYKYPSKEAA